MAAMPDTRLPSSLTVQQSVPGTWSSGGQLQQVGEYNPALRWPASVAVFDEMRKDGKCASVLRALKMPVRGTPWHVVDSPDVNPAVATMVRNQLGLTDSRRRRRGQGISWDPFLRHCLLAQDFGHMFFEPVYTIGPPGPNDTLPAGRSYAHLARMAPILPQTISGFNINDDGSLDSIEQQAAINGGQWKTVPLPAATLLAVVNDREGSDWAGTSMLRAAYKDWMIKDRLERMGPMIAERNGMGVPVYKHSEDGSRMGGLRVATSFRAGDLSGVSMPNTDDLTLQGVTGTTYDPLPLVQYHSQEIARSVLAMFLDLGHDNGARNLGETFVDYFTMAINAVITDLEETFTEGLSRRIVELNFGPDEAYPAIAADDITAQPPLTAQSIQMLIAAGVVTPDPALEEFVRQAFSLPPVTTAADNNAEPVEPVGEPILVQGARSSMSGAPTLDARQARLAWMRRRMGRR